MIMQQGLHLDDVPGIQCGHGSAAQQSKTIDKQGVSFDSTLAQDLVRGCYGRVRCSFQ